VAEAVGAQLNVALSAAIDTDAASDGGVIAVPPLQAPPPHASPTVQGLPSSQLAPLFAWTHPDVGSQPSSVHTLLSLQTTLRHSQASPIPS
jgi:hypothetical protein